MTPEDNIPIHILDYIDARFAETNRKIDACTASVNSWMEKEPAVLLTQCEKLIDEAIPTSEENPDAIFIEKRKEHRLAHYRMIKQAEGVARRWIFLRDKVAGTLVVTLITGAIYAILWGIPTWIKSIK